MFKHLLKIKFPNVVRHMSTPRDKRSPIRVGVSLAFGKYLLATNILSSGVLMVVGDGLQQQIEYHQENKKKTTKRLDYGRLTRMFIIGIVFGYLNHYFYMWMAKILPDKNIKSIRRKMILDQVVMSPFSIVIFFYGMGFMESKSLAESTKELKHKFVKVYLMDSLMCTSQFVNFYYVPVKYQVFYVNVVAVLYSMFLSYFKHN